MTVRHQSADMDGGGHDAMEGGGSHGQMTLEFRKKWLWVYCLNIALGVWLMSSPFTFGYADARMVWSDLISGGAIAVLGVVTLASVRMDFLGRVGICLVGVWLQFAPLVFWAKDPAAYVTDTLIGALVIAFSILVPMMPGMAHHMAMMKPGPDIPPGWTYCPSTWHQRVPLIALGFAGWFVSRYLAAFQLGYTDTVWEPFFGDGTVKVLRSEVSHMMPISDAGLGAVAYTVETLMAWMGGRQRWRTMPWMVTFFGILVVPLGLTHILLVSLQPVMVGEWCTLCLLAAVIMLFMIPFMVDEVVAMLQFMQASVRAGKPFWRTFWVGDTVDGGAKDERSPQLDAPAGQLAASMAWGVSVPWNLAASALLGLWLMFAPAIFGSTGAAAQANQVGGALVITVAVVAWAEVLRAARFVNALLGVGIVLSPWLISGAAGGARWSDLAVGAALIALSLPRGPVRERYGEWNRFIV